MIKSNRYRYFSNFALLTCFLRIFKSADAFSPCAPPRFDEFSEKLITKWDYGDQTGMQVEEVMRSCGGAVQGIREFPPIGGETDDGLYLNRANDGFIFYNDGSYSFGPINNWNQPETFLSSLSFGKARVVVWSDINHDSGEGVSIAMPEVVYAKRSSTDLDLKSVELLKERITEALGDFTFGNKIRCSMQSTSQPWMLQRVKWNSEKGGDKSSTFHEMKDENIFGDFQCWVEAQSVEEYNQWSDSSSVSEDGVIVNMGVLCKETGLVRAIARHYSSEKSLVSVTFLKGKKA